MAAQATPNFYLNRATNVSFESCVFSNFAEQPATSNLKGTFMQIIAESNIVIKNSYFTNGRASSGGALYLLGDSSIEIESSKFIDNVAERKGGAISAESFK